MTEPDSDPTPGDDLRDRIAERARDWAFAYPISSNFLCRTEEGAQKLARIWGDQIARAVMPIVEKRLEARQGALHLVTTALLTWQCHAQRAEAAIERVRAIPRQPPTGRGSADWRAYRRGWQDAHDVVDRALGHQEETP